MAKSGARDSIVVGRYATALLDLAEEKGAIDAVSADLAKVEALASECTDFSRFLASPLIPKPQQTKFMDALAERGEFSPLVRNFIRVLIANGRLALLSAAAEQFSALRAVRGGEIAVKVETARAMSDEQKEGVQAKMSAALGRTVRLEASVDPSIIGGMVITVGSTMIDDSVRRKLESLGSVLTKGSNQNAVQNLKEVG